MSLRSQIAVLLILFSVVLVTITYAIQRLVVMPAFEDLERQAAQRDAGRCVDAIEREISLLSHLVLDWSAWDEIYIYTQDRNERFTKANLHDETCKSAHVSLLAILNEQRQIVWSDIRDLETNEPLDTPDLLQQLTQPQPAINQFTDVHAYHAGILPTSRGPMLFASRPIVTSKHHGPIRGTMVMGRFMGEREIAELVERTHVALRIWDLTRDNLPPEARAALEQLPAKGVYVHEPSQRFLHAYTAMDDLFGQKLLLLQAELPRQITAQGAVAARAAMWCSLAGGLGTLLLVWGLLRWRIVGPLQRMADHAVRVGQRDDMKARLNFRRADEVGTLAAEFDRMVENLAESRKKVLETAHRAGMAEIAAEVLHNVGNAVNSANCSAERLEEQLQRSKVAGLDRAAALLAEQAPRAAEFFSADPRGKKWIDYLLSLNRAVQTERAELVQELHRLRDTIRHIRDAIAAQQSVAGRSDFRQETSLPALVGESLRLNEHDLLASGITVDVQIAELPEVLVNKSKLTQILVNLIRNAVQSLEQQPPDRRKLTIQARGLEDGSLEIEVRDTGVGFSEDVRVKLFTHGFTTRPDGHGLGLHYCANAVQEAGGSITAESKGPGQGATFRLRIPHALPAPTLTA